MIYFKKIELDKHDLETLHDIILDVFDVNVSDSQIEKLFELTPYWDGQCDTEGISQFMNNITEYFIDMEIPMYGSQKDYKDKFWSEIERIKPKFIEFIGGIS